MATANVNSALTIGPLSMFWSPLLLLLSLSRFADSDVMLDTHTRSQPVVPTHWTYMLIGYGLLLTLSDDTDFGRNSPNFT